MIDYDEAKENLNEDQKQSGPKKPNKAFKKVTGSSNGSESISDIEGNVDEESKLDPDIKYKQFPGMIR